MNYLLKTPKGVFLVEAPDYNKACEYGRLSGIADQADGIQMLGGFAPSVRYASKLMTSLVVCEPDLLKKAVEGFMVSHVERSWMGSRDAESHEEIEKGLEEATKTLELVTGLKFGDT